MEFILMTAVLMAAMFYMDTTTPTRCTNVHVDEDVRILSDEEVYRAHRVHAAVLGAKFALRHNNPMGYKYASEEMRKYI